MVSVSKEELFLKNSFQKFYEKHEVNEPPEISKREFGFGFFRQKISQRHLSFENYDKLNSFLREDVPFYISYSASCYQFPSARPMDAKKFLKSDILYEFDADDLKTDCRLEHDSWKCPKCGAFGKGPVENCTSCGERAELKQWFCKNCLDEVKKQVFKLLDFLEKDFGFTEGISMNFSGNAGYHIHLRNESIQLLSHNARIELLDYLTAKGLDIFSHGFSKEEKYWRCPDNKRAVGWSRRILDTLKSMIEHWSVDDFAVCGDLKMLQAKRIVSKREFILKKLNEESILYNVFGGSEDLVSAEKLWTELIKKAIDKSKVSLSVDRQTSIDLHKIIRVPDTLHGSTGLLAKSVSLEKLSSFNPFDDCVVLSANPTKVFISEAPKFNLKGLEFGPFNSEEAELPEFAAAYLVGKGLASIKV